MASLSSPRHGSATVSLVLGGARSGKSRFAEDLLEAHAGRRIYLATAEPGDEEMRARIADHRRRRGEGWRTMEAPLDIASAITEAGEDAILLDCLTLWLANLMSGGRDIPEATEGLAKALAGARAPVVLVSNEVGLGIVPDNPLARAFRDHAGRLNQTMAALADRVFFLAAGLPITLKDRACMKEGAA
jgi:adenosylcobinamide kinase / adenosylcobinamide-phosphate guanylyltransferase